MHPSGRAASARINGTHFPVSPEAGVRRTIQRISWRARLAHEHVWIGVSCIGARQITGRIFSSMAITRRGALGILAGSVPAILIKKAAAAAPPLEIASSPYQGTRESLAKYTVPEWFRDARLGLWAHWGPQSAPEQGDWFARRMYLEGTPVYEWHLAHFGHPSKSGYKGCLSQPSRPKGGIRNT